LVSLGVGLLAGLLFPYSAKRFIAERWALASEVVDAIEDHARLGSAELGPAQSAAKDLLVKDPTYRGPGHDDMGHLGRVEAGRQHLAIAEDADHTSLEVVDQSPASGNPSRATNHGRRD